MNRRMRALLLSPGAKRFVDRMEAAVPLIRKWHRFEYEEHFLRVAKWERMFSGVYPTYAAAFAAIPATHRAGHNSTEAAQFLDTKSSIRPSDYPVLFWLARLLPENPRVFDFGGNTGVSYFSFEHLLNYQDKMEWTVYDVPAVVRAAENLAAKKKIQHLRFTVSMQEAEQASLLLVLGSAQFTEQPFVEILRSLSPRPGHLIFNKIPLGEGETFFTLNNFGPAIAPYRVANRAEFLQSLAGLGYEVIDQWENPDYACYIPFYPDHAIRAFSGMYLRRKAAAG